MRTGTIKFFNIDRFFGFIITDKGDVFFHGKDCDFDPAELKPGTKVQFEDGIDKKSERVRAEEVKLI
ncbi:cold shock domain-containing protein [Candidatus Aerophobetes bacterium]|nr:cold shock domain-containing protein [Candidatus Aerophobetes bacterium]